MKNIIVLGGGTAGMFSALFSQRVFPKTKITLIKSNKIGIIGAGEGSFPNIDLFLSFLNIDKFKLLSETKGTIKNGISFENWNNDNKKYFHGFNERFNFNVNNVFGYKTYDYYLKQLINDNKSFDINTFAGKLSYENKVDMKNMEIAFHFDARLLADYLEKIFIERGGTVVIGEYYKCISNKNKISNIKLLDNTVYPCDFIFDCTGFARLINGKFHGDSFISFKKMLPIKRAIPFFLKSEKELRPYTRAISMKYGWMWQIPLQHRIGAGYVFDSNYISDEEAKEEVNKMLKQDIEFLKPINFEAGRYSSPWINNCISIGLSYHFTEPIEATSISSAIFQLETLLHFIPTFHTLENSDIKLYNKQINGSTDSLVDFIYFHYLCKRKDTVFWKKFRLKNKMPSSLKNIINRLDKNILHFDFSNQYSNESRLFCVRSYIEVGGGLKFIKKTSLEGINISPSRKEYLQMVKNKVKVAKKHLEILNNAENFII